MILQSESGSMFLNCVVREQ